MASESSQSSSPSSSQSPPSVPSPSPGNNVGDAFVGSFISLISKYEIRYEGILYHLNVKDSTLGLKNVRSFGTEGRKKDGPQIPPCDRVYDYILFRGSDIKDLQVNPSPAAQSRPEIQSEQGINQSSHASSAMSSPLSGYDSGYGLGSGTQWFNTPALSSKPVPATQHSSVPLSFQLPPSANAGSLTESPVSLIGSTQSNAGSSMPMPSFVQGNKLGATGVPVSSPSTMPNNPQIIDYFASPIMRLVNDTTQVVTRSPDDASNRSYPSNPSPLGQAQFHTPPGLASAPSNLSPPSEALLSAPNIQNSYPIVPQAVAPGIPGPLSNSPESFFGMDPSLQSRQQMVTRGQEMFPAINPVSFNVPSQSPATRNHAPLLPLPVSAQSRIPSSSIEFTEEFDFEAMNEKFKKSELWGYLGQNNRRNQNDNGEEIAIEPNSEGKPSYNKDDFFDTISCNQLDRVARNGQQHNQFPEHMRQEPGAFGNHFQRPPPLQPGQGAYLAAQSNYRGGYHNNNNNYRGGYHNNNNNNYYSNSGYGYYYGGRGRGGNTHY
ncbi:PREDICTED: decapping 5-like protein isoform X2 [Camelina sativa]|uniref:Decapping 5-like protein isoform X2 n=1 Tax=Camelina sativa TaxID=90675 RepID=A0ABM1QJX6_CAMSA|nr:PREDICTED: decapping 5-like protein isoform X2 [Camelina sativa]